MEEAEEAIGDEYDAPTEPRERPSIGRRVYLKSLGVAIGSVTTAAAASDVTRAASSGYGEGGYGEGPYGGDTGLTVSTTDTTDVTSTSATLNGSLDDLDGASSADCYFEWRQEGASSWNTTAKQTLSSTGAFSIDVTGLEDGVGYEYRSVAEASNGDVDEGATVSFTTTNDPPAVTTGSPSRITDSSATLNGSLDDLGTAASTDCYFEWRQAGASSWNATAKQTLSSTGPFSADITSVSSATDYEYRAVAQASDGDRDTGTTVSFTTDSSNSAPSIDSYSVTEAGSPNPHCEITADWAVSDADGDLDTAAVRVFDSSGSLVDSTTTDVSGSSAGGTDAFKIKHVDDQTFDVTLTVTDTNGSTADATRTVSE
ncbi:MAG: fibronectin type III domain-containing protein [Haloglomus sp.]